MEPAPFHLAFPVNDIAATRAFYVDVLGCKVGRSAERWIDFDLGGHQISAHLVERELTRADTNLVDGDNVPVRHFGLILEWRAWHAFAERLRARGTRFLIEPHVRFKGEVGEQATLFVVDPSGNALEFKSFQDPRRVFAS
ncbi:MAG: VOC family protein [Planctomycetaceae bacterium]|jgi:extradiol dioxygenase family protein|nr:VOC family protein [Planctomycetaceae bacterium]